MKAAIFLLIALSLASLLGIQVASADDGTTDSPPSDSPDAPDNATAEDPSNSTSNPPPSSPHPDGGGLPSVKDILVLIFNGCPTYGPVSPCNLPANVGITGTCSGWGGICIQPIEPIETSLVIVDPWVCIDTNFGC